MASGNLVRDLERQKPGKYGVDYKFRVGLNEPVFVKAGQGEQRGSVEMKTYWASGYVPEYMIKDRLEYFVKGARVWMHGKIQLQEKKDQYGQPMKDPDGRPLYTGNVIFTKTWTFEYGNRLDRKDKQAPRQNYQQNQNVPNHAQQYVPVDRNVPEPPAYAQQRPPAHVQQSLDQNVPIFDEDPSGGYFE